MSLFMAPEDIPWDTNDNPNSPRRGFAFTPAIIDEDYTPLYTVQLGRIGPGGRSKLHRDTYNHAFYFTAGTGAVQLGKEIFTITPGSFVKIPVGVVHGFENTGTDDLEFLVIYDPPFVAGMVEKTPS